MPCHTRMKSIFLRVVLWLYLLELGFMFVSPEPGYLDFDNLPDTNFSCAWRIVGGYYADVEAACQMFHVCTLGQNNETMDIRFLCLNGTVFDQSTRVCERIDEVDCEKSEQYYDHNRELYGNSAPLVIPGDDLGPAPPTTTTTTTTTTSRPKYYSTPTPRHANTPHYYTTAKSKPTHQKLALHHHQFSSDSPPDFRFNPKEINLKLNSDASLDIKPVSYQQQRFNDDKNQHTIVTTHSYNIKNDEKLKKNVELSYDFDYQDDKNYPTGTGLEEEYVEDYKHQESSTARIISTSPIHQGYHFQRSDRPPINPPLIYSSLSSPAPFAHNTGNKRHSDPKIKKSVSVSISDQNGKELAKLNNTPISAIFSDSYLDYSEEEVTLLPLFEDVPKVKSIRTKRDIDYELLKKRSYNITDKEAADILRFLLNWYSDYEKTTEKVTIPLNGETITEINKELSAVKENFKDDVTEELIAKASNTAVEFEKYLEEDYQDYLNNVNNQTMKDVNGTTPEYEYYYYYEDDDNVTNISNSKEVNLNNSTHELKVTDSNEIKQIDEKGNAVEIQLYDYVDDNYEPKTFDKQDVKPRKIDVNEYVDDNYEKNKNEVPAEMILTTPPSIEVNTKEYFEGTKENEIFSVEITTQSSTTTNHFDESTDKMKVETTTPTVIITETTTDLGFMIHNIEKHTKSVATNILMPSHNYSTPVIHARGEENHGTRLEGTEKLDVLTTTKANQSNRVRGRGRNRFATSTEKEIQRSSRIRGRNRYGVVSTTPQYDKEILTSPITQSTENILTESTTTEDFAEINEFQNATKSIFKENGKIEDQIVPAGNKEEMRNLTNSSEIIENVTKSILDEEIKDGKVEDQIVPTGIEGLKEIDQDETLKGDSMFDSKSPRIRSSRIKNNKTEIDEAKELKNDTVLEDIEEKVDEESATIESISSTTNRVDVESSTTKKTRTRPSRIRNRYTLTTPLENFAEEITTTTDIPTTTAKNEILTSNNLDFETTLNHDVNTFESITTEPTSRRITTSTTPIEELIQDVITTTETPIITENTERFETTLIGDTNTPESTTEEIITTQKLDDEFTIERDILETFRPKEPTTPTPITSDVVSSTQEILTTLLENNEEVTTILPEMKESKSLSDMLGYSVYNKLSENEDDSLRELGYFTLPTITTKNPNKLKLEDLSTFTTDENLNTFTTSPYKKRKSNHRFSVNINTELTTITTTTTTTESTTNVPKTTSSRVKGRHRFSVIPENFTQKLKDKSKDIVTDPSLIRSANPTLPRSNFKSTTPIMRVVKVKMRNSNKYTFNCLDKKVNKFYSDPRDCRLFHYCSPGYNSNQAVDMKFVCDMGTYYDDIKRICTKKKPSRCV
ncbi:enolase-phosphatase E1-like [Onthophagus taurus]|uniref:enolase-phosphatase E1-like n=1 Tax=Onthophagus taurus TaxID=166361 RepID=UPI0039BDAAAB